MGYTHYWKKKAECPVEVCDKIAQDVNKLLSNLSAANVPNLAIVDGLGNPNSKPNINKTSIWLNGASPEDYETFGFDHSDQIGFCKTNKKPYDVFVCATLLVIQNHASDFYTITSDGGYDDWAAAINFFTKVFGKIPNLPQDIRPKTLA